MKYNVSLIDGKTFEVDELTYVKLSKRIDTGRINGFYTVSTGPTAGTSFNFPHIASVSVERTAKEMADLSTPKKKSVPEVFVSTSKTECPVDHKDPKQVEVRFVDTDRGTKQYFPVCTKCGWRGTLVKPASILNTYGIEITDIKPYEDGKE